MTFFETALRGVGGIFRRRAPDDPIAAPKGPTPAVPALPGWAPTHMHKKGGLYRVLMAGVLETDRSDVVIYDDADGTVWVRPVTEFYDGRFSPLSTAPPSGIELD